MGTIRRPFVGQITTVTSPEDETVTFDIRRCGVRENIERQNLSSTMRYVERNKAASEDTEIVTERDYPVGSMNLATVKLGLAAWSLEDEQNRAIAITEQTIQSYLSPAEFAFVLKKVLEVNPMWSGNGEEDVKKD